MDKLFDTESAAEFLGVPPKRLLHWRWAGTGPSVIRLGHKTIRYAMEDLIAFIESHRQASRAGDTA
jgi:hypothetical protein